MKLGQETRGEGQEMRDQRQEIKDKGQEAKDKRQGARGEGQKGGVATWCSSLITRHSSLLHCFSLAVAVAVVALTAIFPFAYNHEQDDVNGAVTTQWCNGNTNNGSPCPTPSVAWSLGPAPPPTMVDQVGGPSYVQAIQLR